MICLAAIQRAWAPEGSEFSVLGLMPALMHFAYVDIPFFHLRP